MFIFKIIDFFHSGLKVVILEFTTLFSIISSTFTVVSKNPIISVLCLIGLFLSIAWYLLSLGLYFIGLSYILVYVGAVSILFLFILMLINVRISELVTDTSASIPLALLTIFIFNFIVNEALPFAYITYSWYESWHIPDLFKPYILFVNNNYYDFIFYKAGFFIDSFISPYVTSITWDGYLSENSDITSLGNVLYTSYPIWLIITSIILLLAMIGAIVITIKQEHSTTISQPEGLVVMN